MELKLLQTACCILNPSHIEVSGWCNGTLEACGIEGNDRSADVKTWSNQKTEGRMLDSEHSCDGRRIAIGVEGSVYVSAVYMSLAATVRRLFRFICSARPPTCAHYPLPIIADSYAMAGLFELKVLKELYAIRIFRILLQASLSLACKPLRKRSGG